MLIRNKNIYIRIDEINSQLYTQNKESKMSYQYYPLTINSIYKYIRQK